jgi:beta-alanine degradation protein BauB
MRRVTGVGLAALLVVGTVVTVKALASPSLDPVVAAPQAFKVRLDNDKLRVLEYVSEPGAKDAVHSCAAGVMIAVSSGTFRSTTADGKSKDVEYKAGELVWRDAITHTGENVGKTQLHAFLIELK